MEERTLRLLDFPHLLDFLCQFTLSEGGKQAVCRLQPFSDKENLSFQTELLREALSFSQEICSCLQSFPKLDGVFYFLDQEKPLDEDGLWAVNLVLEQVHRILTPFEHLPKEHSPYLVSFLNGLTWPEKTWQALQRCLNEEGQLRDESSPELYAIRQNIRKIHQQCTRKVDEFLEQEKTLEYLQDNYLTLSADRYVLALKVNFKGRLDGIIHDYSQSGETCYFEPFFLVELNNRLQDSKRHEREAKQQVLMYLTSLALKEQEKLKLAYEWLVSFDLLRAKISFAQYIQAVPISIGHDQPLRLIKARHPLLCLNQDQDQVQPVDIEFQTEHQGLIVSGGNSGGKTVCLKTLGLVSLMALSALPVPVEENSSLPLWYNIFVFLGDEQNLQEHVSTFTAQIEYFKRAWPDMNAQTLVILDEFGAGTDPSQGAALAQAVIDSLLERDVWTMAATHFPALKAYGLSNPKVRAASVLFDPESNHPLYKLAYDQVGSSQALDVARDHGMPRQILQRSEEILLLDGQDSSQLMGRLNELAIERQQELDALQKKQNEVEEEKRHLRKVYNEQIDKLIQEIQEIARSIVQEWKAGQLGRKQALKELHQQKSKLEAQKGDGQEEQKDTPIMGSIAEGQNIYYPVWKKFGQVLDKDEKKKKLKVNLDGVGIWLAPEEVSVVKDQERDESRTKISSGYGSGMSHRIDLRGQRVEEAQANIEKFLDNARFHSGKELEIIHGRGTGVLRDLVHKILRNNEQIESFDFAPEENGGDGVTLVELK